MSCDERVNFVYQTDIDVRLVAPINETTVPPNPLDFTGDGAAATFRVFDAEKDEVLTAAAVTLQTSLSVSNAGKFVIGDQVAVELDSGAIHLSTVNAVSPAVGTISIAVGLPGAAAAGRRIRVQMGPVVTMTAYGTPKLGKRDWGFRGSLQYELHGLKLGQLIDVEIDFSGAVGGGLDLLKVICGVVRAQEDCGACDA